ncbi:MAG: hypothetical protein HRU46_15910, partial [Verrucomicrobiales bacterium]|nr:hypothetical protein [Verrucomicrobiales bacterium]
MKYKILNQLTALSYGILAVAWLTTTTLAESATVAPLFTTEEILNESTLETRTLEDWHPVGATRQKLIEINVAEWWPGQDYRIP